MPGVCYSALRRLPRRDFHPLERNSVTRTVSRPRLHDAPSANSTRCSPPDTAPRPNRAAGAAQASSGRALAPWRRVPRALWVGARPGPPSLRGWGVGPRGVEGLEGARRALRGSGADGASARVRPPLRARPVGSSRPSGRGADGVEAAGPGGTRSSVAGAQPSPAPEPGHPRPRPARAHSQSPAQAFTSRRRSSPGYGHGRTASSGQARTSGKSSAPTRNLDTCPGAGAARDASTSRVPGRPVSTGRRTLHTLPTAGPRPAFASRLTRPPDSLPCPGRVYSPPWNVSIS